MADFIGVFFTGRIFKHKHLAWAFRIPTPFGYRRPAVSAGA
jgi:hypothetical protein